MSKVGRKPKVNESEVLSILLRRKSEVILDSGKLIGKNALVWKSLSNELNGNLSGRTLYAKMCDPAFRKKVEGKYSKLPSSELLNETKGLNDSSIINNSLDEGNFNFKLFADKDEFQKFIIGK